MIRSRLLEAFEARSTPHFRSTVGDYREYHHKLFAHQAALKRPDLEKYAEELELDMSRFRAALDERKHEPKVEAIWQWVRRLGSAARRGS